MGNRAIVKPIDNEIGVYLHWNGEPNQVTAMLEYCKLKKYRDFGGAKADSYGLARFVQTVANWIGGSLSIGISKCDGSEEEADWLDNDIYIVDGWDIVTGVKHKGKFDTDPDEVLEIMLDIDKAQPEKLGADYIKAQTVSRKDLNADDTIFSYDPECSKTTPKPLTVKRIEPDCVVCGDISSETVIYDKEIRRKSQ